MQISQFSSGDPIADRRADYARMLEEAGDAAAAAELLEQALERVPHWAAGWFRLGAAREKAGNATGAAAAFQQALAFDPDDIFGASLKLALLGATEAPPAPPMRYVERLFDDYADRFDAALVERLDYTVPQKLGEIVAGTGRHYRCGIDLGCGTGLMGPHLRPRVDRLEGYDLSENMLAKAQAKTMYDRLAQADLTLPPAESGVFDGSPAPRADLVTAADVLMYLGDLRPFFSLVDTVLLPGGDLAFSVEKAPAQEDFSLQPSLRYAHSLSYVTRLCAVHGLTLVAEIESQIRTDAGKPVIGMLFLARKPG